MENFQWEQVFNYLEQLGATVTDKVVLATKTAYPIIVKQVYVDALKDAIWMIFGLVLIISAIILFKKTFKNSKYRDGDWSDGTFIIAFFSTIGGVLGLIIFMTNLFYGVARLINTHWYAAKKIFELMEKQ